MTETLTPSIAEQRVSLVCLSIGRSWTLDWQKSYWRGFPVHLIYADGTPVGGQADGAGFEGSFSWEALALPRRSYLERLDAALARCDTEFVALIDDEEVYFFSGINRAIELLDAEQRYSCAGGTVSDARLSAAQFLVRPWAGRLTDWSEPFQLEADDPCVRVARIISMMRTANLYYTVVRTHVLRHIVEGMQKLDLSKTLPGYEIALTAGLAISGTYCMGNYLFWCRMGSSAPHSTLRETLNREEVESIGRFLIDLDGQLGQRSGSNGPVDGQVLQTQLSKSMRERDYRRLRLPPAQPGVRAGRIQSQFSQARLVGSFNDTEVLVDDMRWAAGGLEVHDEELMHLAETALNGIRPHDSLTEP